MTDQQTPTPGVSGVEQEHLAALADLARAQAELTRANAARARAGLPPVEGDRPNPPDVERIVVDGRPMRRTADGEGWEHDPDQVRYLVVTLINGDDRTLMDVAAWWVEGPWLAVQYERLEGAAARDLVTRFPMRNVASTVDSWQLRECPPTGEPCAIGLVAFDAAGPGASLPTEDQLREAGVIRPDEQPVEAALRVDSIRLHVDGGFGMGFAGGMDDSAERVRAAAYSMGFEAGRAARR